jgi:GntR family phosphonate transport system transcriptional regulator
VTAALSACGVPDFSRSFTRVSTRLANEAEAKLLKLPKSMPVLVTESVEVDPTATPVKYGVARFAGDRVNLFIES